MSGRFLQIYNEAMGRKVCLWQYGYFGYPLIVFPSAAGMAHEWESHSMIETHADLLGRGKVKFYCTESNVSESWTSKHHSPQQKVQNHMKFEHYVIKTLVPHIYQDCKTDHIPIAVTGVSVGAYLAVNFALKYPHIFRLAIGLSGRYDVTNFTDGYSDQEIYFNNPLSYVAGLGGPSLDHVRQNTRITLICGAGRWEDGNIEETVALGKILDAKGIDCTTDIWGRDSDHQWPWWKKQTKLHFHHEFDR